MLVVAAAALTLEAADPPSLPLSPSPFLLPLAWRGEGVAVACRMATGGSEVTNSEWRSGELQTTSDTTNSEAGSSGPAERHHAGLAHVRSEHSGDQAAGRPPPATSLATRRMTASLRWVVDHMLSLGFSKSLSEWIGSNLKDNEHVTWAFDLQAAMDMFNSYRDRSYWTLLEHPPKSLEIAIVQAERSDRWHPDDVQRLKALSRRESKPDAGKVSLHVLPSSGHWVHVDNPKGLPEIMAPNFLSTVKN